MKKKSTKLDYHEGLSVNQVTIILRLLRLDEEQFYAWLHGQTRPIVPRETGYGKIKWIGGVFEEDLIRWIKNKKMNTPLVWD